MVRTIKFIQTLLILSGILVSTTSVAIGAYACTDSSPMIRGGEGGGDFPWPLALPFPWGDVQGVWKVAKGDRTYYIGIRRTEAKRLTVALIDTNRCSIVGIGPGLDNDTTVVAQITNNMTGEIYRVGLYAFDEKDSPEPPLTSVGDNENPDRVMVARIRSLNTSAPEIAAQIVRISDKLEFKCGGQDKKLRF